MPKATHKHPSSDTPPDQEIRVSMVSLGCAKNLVDSEVILGHIGESGLTITQHPEDADVVIINTCGFIESAKEESIQTILEMCELKKDSPTPKKVVVAGCLGQRYGEELRKQVPEVDAIIGLAEYDDIGTTIRKLSGPGRRRRVFRVSDPNEPCHAEVGRFRLTPPHYAYVKISDGCDNPCTFCAIPAIRGRFRSKPVPAILEEVRELVSGGTKEVILIAQDTTSYGVDLSGEFELPRLLREVEGVDGVEWIRILYVYPSFMNDEMIDSIAALDKVVKYIDVPLQHISDTMLRRMGRRSNEAKTRALLQKMRDRIPGLFLRTTFLVGSPGEDQQEFDRLLEFVREFRFERLGVFGYSEEEGTPAASFPGVVPEEIRKRRTQEIMLAQQENAFRHNESRKGEIARVLVDEVQTGRGGGVTLRARSYGEAPEIDPSILVRCVSSPSATARPGFRELSLSTGTPIAKTAIQYESGSFLDVRITGSRDYDLLAEPVPVGAP